MSPLYSNAGVTQSAAGGYGSGAGHGSGGTYRRRWRPRVPRSFTDPIAYGHAVGRIRVLEGRMLSHQRLERLIEVETPAEQVRILAETEFGRIFDRLDSVEDVERGLDEHLGNVYHFIQESCPKAWLNQLFRMRYDFHNLRVYLKAVAKEEPPEHIWQKLGLIAPEVLEQAAAKRDWGALPQPQRTAAEDAWWRFEETGDVIAIDQALDAVYYAARLELARTQRNDFLLGLVKTEIDLANLKAFLRGRRLDWEPEQVRPALVEGGTLSTVELAELYLQPLDALAGLLESTAHEELVARVVQGDSPDLELLDKFAADITAGLIERGRRVAVGPEPVVAYVWNREQEAAALRIVLAGKLAGLPAKRLEERVRNFYGWAASGWQ